MFRHISVFRIPNTKNRTISITKPTMSVTLFRAVSFKMWYEDEYPTKLKIKEIYK